MFHSRTRVTSKRRIFVAGIIFAIASLLVFMIFEVSRPAHADSTNGKILYVGSRDTDGNDEEIYVMDADGANQTQLTSNDDYEYEPAWSANGQKVIFTSDRDGDEELFVMDTDGTDEVKLTNNTDDDWGAAWAPDNSKIAFVSSRDGNDEIYVMDIDGSNQTRLTNDSADDYTPVWSPDSETIVFVSERNSGDAEIYSMDADGSNETRITTHTGFDGEPDFSPDGTKIAFSRQEVIPNSNIYTMNADGTGITALTSDTFPILPSNPSWSNDGTKIAYNRDPDGDGDEIFVINANGTGVTQLTNIVPDSNYNTNPDWGGNDTTGGGSGPDTDTDDDGIDDSVEAAGPNGGDANNDGTADSAQANVTSFVNAVTGNRAVLQSTCTSHSGVGASVEPSDHADVAFDYPVGLLAFTLTCASPGTTVTVSLYFYEAVDSPVLRKYNSNAHSYQAIGGASLSMQTIGGQSVVKTVYQITDGSPLDQDGAINGTIVDPVGLGQAVVGIPRTGLGGRLYN